MKTTASMRKRINSLLEELGEKDGVKETHSKAATGTQPFRWPTKES